MKRYEEAYTEYTKAIETDPEYGEAYANLAVVYFMADDYVDSWLNLQLAKKYGAATSPDLEKTLVSRMQQ